MWACQVERSTAMQYGKIIVTGEADLTQARCNIKLGERFIYGSSAI